MRNSTCTGSALILERDAFHDGDVRPGWPVMLVRQTAAQLNGPTKLIETFVETHALAHEAGIHRLAGRECGAPARRSRKFIKVVKGTDPTRENRCGVGAAECDRGGRHRLEPEEDAAVWLSFAVVSEAVPGALPSLPRAGRAGRALCGACRHAGSTAIRASVRAAHAAQARWALAGDRRWAALARHSSARIPGVRAACAPAPAAHAGVHADHIVRQNCARPEIRR